jgi:hypothetical protein
MSKKAPALAAGLLSWLVLRLGKGLSLEPELWSRSLLHPTPWWLVYLLACFATWIRRLNFPDMFLLLSFGPLFGPAVSFPMELKFYICFLS